MVMKGSIDQDILFAFEKYFDDNSYDYLSLEEKMQSMQDLLEMIQNQAQEATRLSEISKFSERVGYIEERMDEVVSPLYNRRRRSKRFRFSDFFTKYQEQMGKGAESEVSSLKEAFDLLGLSGDENMLKVTTAFRALAKKYHPDARGGDRSGEIELRKIVGAYQYIKQNHPDK
jgi:hypothetical protein